MMLQDSDCETAYTEDGAGFINVEVRHLPTGMRASGSAKSYNEARGIARERLGLMYNTAELHGNIGHGHVFPRPDGVMARCGGPGLCAECNTDFAQKGKEMNGPSTSVVKTNEPHVKAYLTTALSDTMDEGTHHYTVKIECTCGWTATISNSFPRSMVLDRDVYFEALMKGATDGVELALIVHREGKIG